MNVVPFVLLYGQSGVDMKRWLRKCELDDNGGNVFPLPTQVISNEEFYPLPQTTEQQKVELYLVELADNSAKQLGITRRQFLANLLLKLASPSCAVAADEYLAAEDEKRRAFHGALELVRVELEASSSPRARYLLIDAIQRLKKGKSPDGLLKRGPYRKWLEALEQARSRRAAAHRNFERVSSEAASDLALALRDIAELDRFKEAIIWQNRHAFHTGVENFLSRLSNGATLGLS